MSINDPEIPDIVIRRLPIYAQTLTYLTGEGVTTVSSSELGARIGVTAAQIRRDLSYFGEFGKQGKGYNVQFLLNQVRDILHLGHSWGVALVGVGLLGKAIVHYTGFKDKGFEIKALFDSDTRKLGGEEMGMTVNHFSKIPEIIPELGLNVAIVAVPAHSAQEVVDLLIKAGVKAILNYAPITVQVPADVRIRSLDPVAALQSMTYYLNPDPKARSRNGKHSK
ncbi:MAG: redox-sensing transcriptional repressor Rex [Chloroflexi bacterium]|uniref:Redox-sensing transcriptional repressor Rex n=1 Tax=Candidatus Chlorohelix allophototropha TaxID=3003348 RepID=A0A8T7M7B2_9CHLR|nr:redox-sensing transcriptional repressor Rex [Chloroflexota bacterium]WJW69941.1 redox-sensing transcriptional repressor Rex [Chloroflexota bacterium L227-S17]